METVLFRFQLSIPGKDETFAGSSFGGKKVSDEEIEVYCHIKRALGKFDM